MASASRQDRHPSTDLYVADNAVLASDGGRFDMLDPATGGVVKNGR
jgi:hypothetical protein